MIRLHEIIPLRLARRADRPLRKSLRVCLPVGLLAAVLLLTGCYRVDSEWVFRADLSSDFLVSFAVDKLLLATGDEDCETELKEFLEYDDSMFAGLEDSQIDETVAGGASMEIAWDDNGAECVGSFSVSFPSGGLSYLLSGDGSEPSSPIMISHDNGSWRFAIPGEPIDSSELPDNEWLPDYVLPDYVLRDIEVNFTIELPGEAVDSNAHSVIRDSGSTKFVWRHTGTEAIRVFSETGQYAETRPAADTRPAAGTGINVVAVVVLLVGASVTAAGVVWLILAFSKVRAAHSDISEHEHSESQS